MTDFSNTVLNWLTANREVFGIPAQNWMLVIGGGLLIYIAALAIAGSRQSRGRDGARD
jgi:hypothetical protein